MGKRRHSSRLSAQMRHTALYNAELVRDLADALYRRATLTLLGHALVGLGLGGGAGWAASITYRDHLPAEPWLPYAAAGAGALLLGLTGLFSGRAQALGYRLQAQLALCQLQIEENTRGLGRDRGDDDEAA
ncbi:MAG: hypothetical protein KF878_12510 [Planctomycetes bacterium]|nr:hypothetical protein [Planctomycetota bacterium]